MANLSYSQQFKKIKDDVRVKYDKITKELAKEAQKDMTKAAYSILQDYYDSYNPKYYVRTYNLYHMVFYKYTILEKENGHVGSISTNPIFMFDNYNISPVNVYDLVWNNGHRGLPYQSFEGQSWYPTIMLDKTYTANTPHNLMQKYIGEWGRIGRKKIKTIEKKYVSNEYKKFI